MCRVADASQPPRPMNCSCSTPNIRAVHAYLEQHFPDCVLRDLHAPARLMQAGLRLPHAEHHVVSIAQEGVLSLLTIVDCMPVAAARLVGAEPGSRRALNQRNVARQSKVSRPVAAKSTAMVDG